MKDAYSFDADLDGLRASYKQMYDAYHRVFDALRPHVPSGRGAVGRDRRRREPRVHGRRRGRRGRLRLVPYVRLRRERRSRAARSPADPAAARAVDAPPMEKVHTPDMPGIAPVAKYLGVDPSTTLKCIAFDVDGDARPRARPGRPRGQRVRARRPRSRRSTHGCSTTTTSPSIPSCRKGYIGPHHPDVAVVVADPVGRGADRVGHRRERDRLTTCATACSGRDFTVDVWADLVTIVSGDVCPRCGNPLSVDRGIEVGHVFQLGDEVLRGARRDVHRRERRAAPDADGVLRHRHLPDRRRRRRGVPRRARPGVARRARAVRRAPHRRARPR